MNTTQLTPTPAPRPRSDEHEQAIIRLAIVSLLVGSLFYSFADGGIDAGELPSLLLTISYLAISVALLYVVRKFPNFSATRAYFAMAADTFVTSYCMYLAGPPGAILFFVYVWLIVGYGFRYGLRFLFACMVLSIVGFTAVITRSEYWVQHGALSVSLLVGLVVLPIFTSVLVRRLHEALRRAEEANKAKSQFLARMSHELRTPLHAIVSTTELLSAANYTQEQRGMFYLLRDSVDVLLRQVDQVLDLSKIEAGRMERMDAPFNLSTLVRANVAIFQAHAAQKGVQLQVEMAPQVPTAVVGDARHLGEILQNLVGNAVKFTAGGSVTVRVGMRASSNASVTLRFEVSDTGIGIAPEFLPRLFQSFEQEDDSRTRQFEGSGLGTAIAKQLVQLLRGTIGVESVKGVGSTFWFELPFGRPLAPPRSDITASAESAPAPPVYGQGRRVLIADDNAVNRLLIERVLADAGFKVTLCSNGDEAKSALSGAAYDLAILDVHMPDKGGLEVVRELRAAGLGQGVRLMMLTADVTTATRHHCEELGLAYVAKPISRQALLAAIAKALGEAHPLAPTQTPPVSGGTRFDETAIAHIAAVANGEPEFVSNMLMLFLTQANDIWAQVQLHVARGAWAEVAALAHKLEGSAGAVGATELVAACHALHEGLHNEQRAHCVDALGRALAATAREFRLRYHLPSAQNA